MQTQTTRRVIVGISDTLAGYQAVRYAVTRARECDAPLVAARAFRCDGTTVLWRDTIAEANNAYVRRVFADALGGLPTDVPTEIAVREDDVVRALVKIADRSDDLLIIGGTDRHWWSRWRARVARRCAREAACPTVVVPSPLLARRSFAKLAKDVVREADLLLTAPAISPAVLPPKPGPEKV